MAEPPSRKVLPFKRLFQLLTEVTLMGIITVDLWPQLSLVKNPRDIYVTQICSKSLGTCIFFSHHLIYFCRVVFVLSSCTFFFRVFTCHLDRRRRGKNICWCRHFDGGLPSLPRDNGMWLRVSERETSGRDFVEMKKEH